MWTLHRPRARGGRPRTCGPLLVALLCLSGSLANAQVANYNRIVGQVMLYDVEGEVLEDHANVVLFLEGELNSSSRTAVEQPIPRISHKGRMFNPRVLPIVKGDQIDFYNDDSIYHNVFSVSRAKPFDLGIYPQGSSKVVEFDQLGLVKLYCNIHPKMVSMILVLDNPFFAMTMPSGEFEIDNIPDGEYVLRIWHELSEEQRVNITLSNGQVLNQQVELRLTKKIVKHKNKFGNRYQTKY